MNSKTTASVKEPVVTDIKGTCEKGKMIFLKNLLNKSETPPGSYFPLGSTGMIALGKGLYCFSDDFKDESGCGTTVKLYKASNKNEGFKEI